MAQTVVRTAACGGEQRRHQLFDAVGPVGERARLLQAVDRLEQGAGERQEAGEQFAARLGGIGERQVAEHQLLGRAGQRAQQEASEARLPGVVVERRQIEAFAAAVGIEAPADPGRPAEVAQGVDVTREQAEAPLHGPIVEQVQHLVAPEARIGEFEHVEQRAADGQFARRVAIGEVERQSVGERTEHGVRVGRVLVDVGHQHQDVARLQARIVAEGAAYLVAHDLEFALRAVAVVHPQRCVVGTQPKAPGSTAAAVVGVHEVAL
ncbi:MAG TPA: hypothetical protein ENI87_01045 [bacterium]|nr:hypothetical protein [bacterium]